MHNLYPILRISVRQNDWKSIVWRGGGAKICAPVKKNDIVILKGF
jgi:hypothetical protein